ncbi:hypothetical protein HPB47_017216 [Ixodes persulcatus]|uniref:Uncharacterized protein n=1 Tax=Ixodes persulcatus TaxID=34615 RepID=A0AC60QNV1_IXOPE|nr:hypothetical protein HPB47_017216 [Ixodes persulcatus]
MALRSSPRHRSSPGLDGITNQALKNIDEMYHPALLEYINTIWRTAQLPDSWKDAITVPLLKQNKPAREITSYRPISLTSCFVKLMERMVLRRLVYHLEVTRALPDCFAGFRHQRCTADALGDLVSALEQAKAQKWSAVMGSVISPLLFSLAISSLPTAARVGEKPNYPINMAVYADDVAIWATSSSHRRQTMVREVQRAITNTIYRLAQLGRNTSGEKSVAICYAPRRINKRIAAREDSEIGRQADTLVDIAGPPPIIPKLPTGHEEPDPLLVDLHIEDLRSKKTAATTTARQLAEHHLERHYDGWTGIFTDGSVHPTDKTATAAAYFQTEETWLTEKLLFHASSTTAEQAAIGLSVRGIIAKNTAPRSLHRAPPLALVVANNAIRLKQLGHALAFQWLPSYCGISGSEIADQLESQAHKDLRCPTSAVTRFADAKLLIRRKITSQHPDPGIAATVAVLHRLRTGSAFTPVWLHRLRRHIDPNCEKCSVPMTKEHSSVQGTPPSDYLATLRKKCYGQRGPRANNDGL